MFFFSVPAQVAGRVLGVSAGDPVVVVGSDTIVEASAA